MKNLKALLAATLVFTMCAVVNPLHAQGDPNNNMTTNNNGRNDDPDNARHDYGKYGYVGLLGLLGLVGLRKKKDAPYSTANTGNRM